LWDEVPQYFLDYFLGAEEATPIPEATYQTATYGYGQPSASQIKPGAGVKVFGGDGQGSPEGVFDDKHGFRGKDSKECDQRVMLVSYVSATPDDSDADTHWKATLKFGKGFWFPFSGAVFFGKAALASAIVAMSLY
jgi:hypothetical protein